MMRHYILLPVLVFILNSSIAQEKDNKYPRGYFMWPVGSHPEIVANFGELRKNHYHMGLDGRTQAKENLPVYAAADGYVSKVKIEPFGFGRAIYINHPNGLTTVYAHLNDFYPALEAYVKKRQYEMKSWKIFLENIPANLFPVKKGAFIAFSGNTGGSQGPHLHFEIRDTKSEKVLNPLLFDMPIKDLVPPHIHRLAIFDRNLSTYEQNPKLIHLRKKGNTYHAIPSVIDIQTDKISFAINAYDRNSGSANQNGIYKAVLIQNDLPICQFVMDNISYDETRYLNAHIDYRTKMNGGSYLQHLSKLPGNKDGVYNGSLTDGTIRLEEGKIHTIRIEVYDTENNKSDLQFEIRKQSTAGNYPKRDGILFSPNEINIFESDSLRFYLAENALYDSVRFRYSVSRLRGRKVHNLHNAQVPVHSYFTLNLIPDFKVRDTSRVIIKRTQGSNEEFKKAYYRDDWYAADFRDFGNFECLEDSTPPVITAAGFQNGTSSSHVKKISFTVTDNTKEIKSFTGLLNGKWLLFSNDKGKTFVYIRDEYWGEGPQELKITAEDFAGNKTTKTFNFTE